MLQLNLLFRVLNWIGSALLLQFFWNVVDGRFCWGFWQKQVFETWCLDGEVVVVCVVNVVVKQPLIGF